VARLVDLDLRCCIEVDAAGHAVCETQPKV
jgi:hypothetical protein